MGACATHRGLLGDCAAARELQDRQLGAVLLVPWYLRLLQKYLLLPGAVLCCYGSAALAQAGLWLQLSGCSWQHACVRAYMGPAAAVLYGECSV